MGGTEIQGKVGKLGFLPAGAGLRIAGSLLLLKNGAACFLIRLTPGSVVTEVTREPEHVASASAITSPPLRLGSTNHHAYKLLLLLILLGD